MSDGRLEALVSALLETFGDRALDVARSQRDQAEGETLAAWAAIVDRLEGLKRG